MMKSWVFVAAIIAQMSSVIGSKIKRGFLNQPGTLGGYGIGGGLGHLNNDPYGFPPLGFAQPSGSFRLGFPPGPSQIPPPFHVGTNVHTTITKQIVVPVPHPVPVPVERRIPVPYPVERRVPVPHPVPVPVERRIPVPYPVERRVPVPHPVPVPVERRVPVPVPLPQPYPVPLEKPYPVPVPKPYPVPVDRPVPLPVDRPYGVPLPVPFPVEKPVGFPVPEPYPVPVAPKNPSLLFSPPPYPPRVYRNGRENADRYGLGGLANEINSIVRE